MTLKTESRVENVEACAAFEGMNHLKSWVLARYDKRDVHAVVLKADVAPFARPRCRKEKRRRGEERRSSEAKCIHLAKLIWG